MISKQEVERVARLARLELTENEIEKMQKDLSEVFDYFELLKKAPKPTESGQGARSRSDIGPVRKDEVISSRDIADELIGAAPDKKDDYIKVKTIL